MTELKSNNSVFIYDRRFDNSTQKFLNDTTKNWKKRVFKFIGGNKFLSKYLDHFELYSLQKKPFIEKDRLARAFDDIISIDSYPKCQGIKMPHLVCFEALEIDDFHNFKGTILNKFAHHQPFLGSKKKEDLKKSLYEVKDKLNYTSWGHLFTMNLSKNANHKSDLIDSIDTSYIKTNESYFILKMEVRPSKKFQEIFDKIVSSDDVALSVPNFNKLKVIIKTQRFISHETFINSVKNYNLNELIFDLNRQVQFNVTSHFKGFFQRNRNCKELPCIEYYEVDDLKEFHDDKVLFDHFRNTFYGYYSFKDDEIEIHQDDSGRNDSMHLKVVKKKGHKTRSNGEKDLTDYSAVETHYLLDSLAFPTIFQAILQQEFSELNRLKRSIYDFVNRVAKPNLLAVLSFAVNNHRYVRLKQDLTKVLIRSKRFENEFTKRNIYLFTRNFELHEFTPRERKVTDHNKNYLISIIDDLSHQLKMLDSRVKSTNEIFKHLEELNTYKTNYRLQIASIVVAILAFIFTFDKAKSVITSIMDYLTRLW